MSILFLDHNLHIFHGCTCFGCKVSLVIMLCAGKCIKLFNETVFASNLHFPHIQIGLHLGENKGHRSKEPINSGLETTIPFCTYLRPFCTLEVSGNEST